MTLPPAPTMLSADLVAAVICTCDSVPADVLHNTTCTGHDTLYAKFLQSVVVDAVC